MSDGEKDIIQDITDLGVTPIGPTDPLTQTEIKKAKAKRQSRSPSDRHADSVALHIADICVDRKRLLKLNAKLQADLDKLRPEIAALRESYKAALAVNVFSLAMVGGGGALISGAGYSNDQTKYLILAIGISTFVWGFILQITSTWRAVLFRA